MAIQDTTQRSFRGLPMGPRHLHSIYVNSSIPLLLCTVAKPTSLSVLSLAWLSVARWVQIPLPCPAVEALCRFQLPLHLFIHLHSRPRDLGTLTLHETLGRVAGGGRQLSGCRQNQTAHNTDRTLSTMGCAQQRTRTHKDRIGRERRGLIPPTDAWDVHRGPEV